MSKIFKKKIFNKSAAKQQPVIKQLYFNNCHRTYSCIYCRAHLANHDELISKLFQGNHGRAYLFNNVVNVRCKEAVQRELITGLHAVADILCDSCETILGWKYEQAFEPSQKYKEGKYIIELAHMLKENNWDLTSYNARELLEDTDHNNNPNWTYYNSLKVGEFNGIGTNNYDCNLQTGRRRHSDRETEFESTDLEKRHNNVRTGILMNWNSLNSSGQNSENNENIEIIEGKSTDGMDLLERSLDKLQINSNQENNYSNNININNNNDSKTTRIHMVPAKNDSLCSSHSPSEIISSSASVTDSSSSTSSDEVAASKSSPAPNKKMTSNSDSEKLTPIDQFVDRERPTIFIMNEDSTISNSVV